MIPHSRPHLGDEEIAAAVAVLRSGRLAQGPQVEAFEAECAAFVGRKHAVAVSSGTAALHLALVTLGIADGARLLLPSYACAALVHPVLWQRAEPVLCDNGDDFHPVWPASLDGIDAVIAPHLFGATAPLPDHPVIIEDIAQSIGGDTGRRGRVAVASFYATKLLTTGEGGMLLTDDEALAKEARDRRDYDNRDEFKVRYAYKMTDLQAAIGRVQLNRLPGFIDRRCEIAQHYDAAFHDLPLTRPSATSHVYFRYVVRLPDRDDVQHKLNARVVDAKRPVHKPLHHDLGGSYAGAERAHDHALSLPIHPALSPELTATVAAELNRALAGRTA